MISRITSIRLLSRFYLLRKPFSVSQAMPKKKQGDKKNVVEHGSDNVFTGPIITNKDNTLTILVQARPGAKLNAISEVGEHNVCIQIAAPPVDGEANSELVKYISEILGLRKSDVSIEKGSRSRNKSILVRGINQEVALEALRKSKDK